MVSSDVTPSGFSPSSRLANASAASASGGVLRFRRFLLSGARHSTTLEALDLLNGVLTALQRPLANNYRPPEIAGAKTQLFTAKVLAEAMGDLSGTTAPEQAIKITIGPMSGKSSNEFIGC